MDGIVVMASNNPKKCALSLRHYAEFSRVILMVHQSQLEEFETFFQSKMDPMPEIWTHSIPPRADGQAPMGAIRYYSMEKARRVLHGDAYAILVDDDLLTPRLYRGTTNNTGHSFLLATPKEVRREITLLATEARYLFPYFTCSFNARGHNGFQAGRPYRAVWKWSGIFGFFKSSLNPFDLHCGIGADVLAAASAVLVKKSFQVLQCERLVTEFRFESDKYHAGSPRSINFARFRRQQDVAGLFGSSTNTLGRADRLSLHPKATMRFKRETFAEYR
jgi:hypothetical protein